MELENTLKTTKPKHLIQMNKQHIGVAVTKKQNSLPMPTSSKISIQFSGLLVFSVNVFNFCVTETLTELKKRIQKQLETVKGPAR